MKVFQSQLTEKKLSVITQTKLIQLMNFLILLFHLFIHSLKSENLC
jgi:hypothetical protein